MEAILGTDAEKRATATFLEKMRHSKGGPRRNDRRPNARRGAGGGGGYKRNGRNDGPEDVLRDDEIVALAKSENRYKHLPP